MHLASVWSSAPCWGMTEFLHTIILDGYFALKARFCCPENHRTTLGAFVCLYERSSCGVSCLAELNSSFSCHLVWTVFTALSLQPSAFPFCSGGNLEAPPRPPTRLKRSANTVHERRTFYSLSEFRDQCDWSEFSTNYFSKGFIHFEQNKEPCPTLPSTVVFPHSFPLHWQNPMPHHQLKIIYIYIISTVIMTF